ncbi:MAG: hypothetical protein M9962_04460 [Oligoflexia bacterium]|nr:hypothetical protein [Oligoflexia bacterium]
MKKSLLKIIPILLLSIFTTTPTLYANESNEVLIPIERVEVDQSTASAVRVSIYGNLPNSCVDMKNSKIFEISPYLHQVSILGTQYEGVCLTVVTPYKDSLDLVGLPKGDHKFLFLSPDGNYEEKNFTIY